MLCYAMLCYAMLCYTILYYTILYYTILYYTIDVLIYYNMAASAPDGSLLTARTLEVRLAHSGGDMF